ncbi:MAG: SCO family protein, partial [Gammaproteobacteria bacterium]|nr:SCO family protein [Gammaproteobacteria bacterium]
TLENLRGKVVVVTFIYTACADTCPLLTTKMVGIQKTLGDDFGSKVHFVSITVDPERDRPEVLQLYAAALGCDPAGWAFVTGTETEITDVARAYGVYKKKQSAGDVDHNLLTSIIDQQGMLRVQYMGDRFDPHEFMDDLQSLLAADPAS